MGEKVISIRRFETANQYMMFISRDDTSWVYGGHLGFPPNSSKPIDNTEKQSLINSYVGDSNSLWEEMSIHDIPSTERNWVDDAIKTFGMGDVVNAWL